MRRERVRVGDDPVVHDTAYGGWTACGVMCGSSIHDETIRFMSTVQTEDPVDCMTCLVEGTRGPTYVPGVQNVIELMIRLEPDE